MESPKKTWIAKSQISGSSTPSCEALGLRSWVEYIYFFWNKNCYLLNHWIFFNTGDSTKPIWVPSFNLFFFCFWLWYLQQLHQWDKTHTSRAWRCFSKQGPHYCRLWKAPGTRLPCDHSEKQDRDCFSTFWVPPLWSREHANPTPPLFCKGFRQTATHGSGVRRVRPMAFIAPTVSTAKVECRNKCILVRKSISCSFGDMSKLCVSAVPSKHFSENRWNKFALHWENIAWEWCKKEDQCAMFNSFG